MSRPNKVQPSYVSMFVGERWVINATSHDIRRAEIVSLSCFGKSYRFRDPTAACFVLLQIGHWANDIYTTAALEASLDRYLSPKGTPSLERIV
jgi:hypothetical protein